MSSPNELNMSTPMVTNAYDNHHITMSMVQLAQLWNATALVTRRGGKGDQGPSAALSCGKTPPSPSLSLLSWELWNLVWNGRGPQFVYS